MASLCKKQFECYENGSLFELSIAFEQDAIHAPVTFHQWKYRFETLFPKLWKDATEEFVRVAEDQCFQYARLNEGEPLVVLKDDKIKVFTRGDLHCPYYQTLGETLKANGWEVNIKKVD